MNKDKIQELPLIIHDYDNLHWKTKGNIVHLLHSIFNYFEPKTQHELEILMADLIHKLQINSSFKIDEIEIKEGEITNNEFKVNAYLDNISLIKPIVKIKSTDIKKGKV